MKFERPQISLVRKDSILHCPCGNKAHDRYHSRAMVKICGLNPHPVGDVGPECDEPDERLRVRRFTDTPVHDVDEREADSTGERTGDEILRSTGSTSGDVEMTGFEDTEGDDDIEMLDPEIQREQDSGGVDVLRFVGDLSTAVDDVYSEKEKEKDWVDELEEDEDGPDDNGRIGDGKILDWLSDQLSESEKEASECLESLHLYVVPGLCWVVCIQCSCRLQFEDVWGHLHDARYTQETRKARTQKSQMTIPSKEMIEDFLIQLGADDPGAIPDVPIPPIEGLEKKKAWKCGYEGCEMIRGTPESMRKHWLDHCVGPKVQSHSLWIHPLKGFRKNKQFVRIIYNGEPEVNNRALDAIMRLVEERKKDELKSTFESDGEKRSQERNMVYLRFGWYDMFEDGTEFKAVRRSAVPIAESDEAYELVISDAGIKYYAAVCESLERVSRTTRRWINSPGEGYVAFVG